MFDIEVFQVIHAESPEPETTHKPTGDWLWHQKHSIAWKNRVPTLSDCGLEGADEVHQIRIAEFINDNEASSVQNKGCDKFRKALAINDNAPCRWKYVPVTERFIRELTAYDK